MTQMVDDCPRCKAKSITFDVSGSEIIAIEYGWKQYFEIFGRCKNCLRCTIFFGSTKKMEHYNILRDGIKNDLPFTLNEIIKFTGYVSLKDSISADPPKHLPEKIDNIFREAATCTAVGCWNAAGAMFRATVDLATRPMLPAVADPAGPNARVRRDLGLRLPWMFDAGILPPDLRELSTCIREDGNDAAHQGTLSEADAEDLHDFTRTLLERLYTLPEKLRLAQERRDQRRQNIE